MPDPYLIVTFLLGLFIGFCIGEALSFEEEDDDDDDDNEGYNYR